MSKSFWSSSHKWTYIKMAIQFGVTPNHVFNLAHGGEVIEDLDEKIVYELKEKDILQKRHHRKHSHRSDTGGVKTVIKSVKSAIFGWK